MMTDLEMIKKCAEKVGNGAFLDQITFDRYWVGNEVYDPLHDGAQIAALVQKLKLSIYFRGGKVIVGALDWNEWVERDESDFNRAVVECASKVP